MNSAEPPRELTHIQHEILEAIRSLRRERQRPPSMREVLKEVSLTAVSGLSYQYKELEAKGYLRREAGHPRTVEVRLPGESFFPSEAGEPGQFLADTEPEAAGLTTDIELEQVVWVPVVGRIAAGAPVLAEHSVGKRFPLPKEVVGGEEGVFILEVAGDSMIGAGICDRDWVVVRPLFQPPQDGDIVAATIEGVELEGTVKTYMKVGRHVWLMPKNSAYTPISGDKAKFAGKVVAVLRQV